MNKNSYINFGWILSLLVLFLTASVTGQVKKTVYTYADTLQLDFYTVEQNIDANRPLLLLVHGGGFSGGKRDNPLEMEFCNQMALKGYAVASMSYRLTRKGRSKGFGCDCPALEKMETFIAVSEDISRAFTFLQDRSSDLNFDKDKSILVGSSAGAEGVLNSAFMQHQYQFKHIPDIKPAAVISFAGAMVNADYITKENAIPAMLFHGEKDNLVPFDSAPHHYCDPNREGYIMLDGSKTIADKLETLNESFVFAYDKNGNHEWANKPYAQTELIDMFIRQTVVEHKRIQVKTDLTEKNKK